MRFYLEVCRPGINFLSEPHLHVYREFCLLLIRVSSGESTTISRAIFAALIVLAMTIFSSYNIIIEPMRETASPPVKDIRSFSIPQDVLDYMYHGFVLDVLLVSCVNAT